MSMHESSGLRSLILLLAAVLAPARTSTGQSGGQWAGPFHWDAEMNPLACDHIVAFDEMTHAALIPVGPYQGRVLLWREGVSNTACVATMTTDAWLFLPENPGHLFRIAQPVPYDLFCGGASWDPDGKLLVAGGHPFSSSPPDHALRFDPNQLGAIVPPSPGPPGGVPNASFMPTTISGNPWSANIPMSIGRYYPTVMTLNRSSILSSCLEGTIPGGAQLVLGGWPGGPHGNEGNELFQFIGTGRATWDRTLAPPPGLPGAHAPSGTTEEYTLVPAYGERGSPEYLLDSYPRAFQMAEFDPSLPVNGQILVTSDVETNHLVPQPTTAGRSWVLKPPASTGTGCWEFRRGPQAGNDEPPGTYDRWYGSAVMLHTLAAKNRVLVFGGSQPTGGADYVVNLRVQEYTPSSTPGSEPIAEGTWSFKASLLYRRVYPNAVVLPTGKIFVEGGFGADYIHNTSGEFPCSPLPCPQSVPELYDPGAVGELGSTTALTGSNPVAPFGTPVPRGYHHLAVLLQDGRVLIASGGDFRQPDPPVYPISHYSGEIYSPPYLFQGPRPSIVDHPESVAFSGTTRSTFQMVVSVKRDHLAKIVLTRPASTTHHFDVDQRYIELEFNAPAYSKPQEITATVTAPHESLGPPGWYLLWAVEADAPGARANLLPSDAQLIHFE